MGAKNKDSIADLRFEISNRTPRFETARSVARKKLLKQLILVSVRTATSLKRGVNENGVEQARFVTLFRFATLLSNDHLQKMCSLHAI